jgi:hypothetical protein
METEIAGTWMEGTIGSDGTPLSVGRQGTGMQALSCRGGTWPFCCTLPPLCAVPTWYFCRVRAHVVKWSKERRRTRKRTGLCLVIPVLLHSTACAIFDIFVGICEWERS